MVGARWLVARRVGASVAAGYEMRAAADDPWLTGQPRAIVKKKLKKHISLPESIEFRKYRTVLYRYQRQGLHALRKYYIPILTTYFILENVIDGYKRNKKIQ